MVHEMKMGMGGYIYRGYPYKNAKYVPPPPLICISPTPPTLDSIFKLEPSLNLFSSVTP